MPRWEGRRRPRLEVDASVEHRDALSLELDQAPKAEQSLDVLFAIERAEHASQIVRRGNLRSEAVAKWLALCAPAQVVVTARPRWLGDELELAGARFELNYGPG